MPVAVKLHLVRHTQDFGFGKIIADQLHADGQTLSAETGRQSQGGQAGQIDGNGVNIGEISLHRILIEFVQFRCGGGRGGCQYHIALRQGCLKIVGHQAAQFLGFEVIGIVIAVTAFAAGGLEAAFSGRPDAVPAPQRELLAWALREATTNVLRHAGARSVSVELAPGLVRVTDDGAGAAGHELGNGLRGLSERVRAAGGTLTLTSPAPGGGTGTGPGTLLEVRL